MCESRLGRAATFQQARLSMLALLTPRSLISTCAAMQEYRSDSLASVSCCKLMLLSKLIDSLLYSVTPMLQRRHYVFALSSSCPDVCPIPSVFLTQEYWTDFDEICGRYRNRYHQQMKWLCFGQNWNWETMERDTTENSNRWQTCADA